LTFKDRAEEAVNFYVSVFPNSKVVSMLRSDGNLDSTLEDKGGMPKGSLLHASFVLDGQEYTAFDGGAHFAFTEAFSLVATCETQEELDAIWERLTEEWRGRTVRLVDRQVRGVLAGAALCSWADDGRLRARQPEQGR
jgi:predicted 3-demethylubiquinone-9 3-methyltransferase (glyoxalase superfamily)